MRKQINTLLFDFSYVLLFPADTSYKGTLTHMYELLRGTPMMDRVRFNDELLKVLTTVKNSYTLGVFTAGKMHKAPEIKEVLDKTFQLYLTEDEVGLKKHNPQAFIETARRLSVKPDEIVFVDDKQENVDAATQAGLTAFRFTTNEQLFADFRKLDIFLS